MSCFPLSFSFILKQIFNVFSLPADMSGFEVLVISIQLPWNCFSLVVFTGILNPVFSMQLCH